MITAQSWGSLQSTDKVLKGQVMRCDEYHFAPLHITGPPDVLNAGDY